MQDCFEKRYRGLMGWMVIVSILIHLLFLFGRFVKQGLVSTHLPEPIPLEISPYPQTRTAQKPRKSEIREKQIAESDDAHNRELDPNAKYLSEHSQKAEAEERAKRVDAFRKKTGTGAAASKEKAENITSDPDSLTIPVNPVKKDWKTLNLQDLSIGGDGGLAAASDDYLRTVPEGERTILSTREFKFFSYYHRVKELLRQYWRPNVEYQLTKMWKKGRNISNDELTTKVLVLLNTKGEITKISRLASCGFTELDDAAVRAFERASPFPNPPQGMIDSDGFVRIRWDFILTTDAGPRIQWTTAR